MNKYNGKKTCGIGTYSPSLDGSAQNIVLLCIKDITYVITHSILRAHVSANVMTVNSWELCGHTAVQGWSTGQPRRHEYYFYSAEARVADLSCQKGVPFFLFSHFRFGSFSSPVSPRKIWIKGLLHWHSINLITLKAQLSLASRREQVQFFSA